MSHSTVLVIGEDPEKMLEPYDENLEVESYRDYQDEEKPADHFMHKSLVEEHGLDPDAGWPEFVTAWNDRYSDEAYHYDAEKDRIYHMSRYNPLSKWDWYLLGGRWTGFFALKPGTTGDQGQPGLMTARARHGRADSARKGAIDWDGMRAEHEKDARKEFAKVRAALADAPPLMPWSVYRETYSTDTDMARKAYHAQPGLAALRNADVYTLECPFEKYCLGSAEPENAYVTKAGRSRTMTFAVLDDEGWHERGRMGWWGVVSDEKDDWPDTWQRLVDRAPDDALFSVYDVHI